MKIADQADIFSTSSRTIYKWVKEGYPVRGSLREQVSWVRANRSLEGETLTALKIEKLQILNELARYKLMVEKRELLPREEILDHMRFHVAQIKTFLVTLHRTLPPALVGLDPREMGDVIKRMIRTHLENFQKRMLKIGVEKRG